MDVFSDYELQQLWANDEAPCVSLYMPTHRGGQELREDPITLKNLIREATERLVERGWREPDAGRLLAPVARLIDDTDFWYHQDVGLGLFRSPVAFRFYRVPQPFPRRVVVGNHFHIKPLLPELADAGNVYVLALSRKQVHLFHVSRQGIEDVTPVGLPQDLPDFLRYKDIQKEYQYRKGGSGQRESATGVSHGGTEEDKALREDLKRYFRAIDAVLAEHLRHPSLPLIYAGVEEGFVLYQEVNTYPHLLEEFIAGNPDRTNPDALYKAAWAVMEPRMAAERRRELARFRELVSSARASSNLANILPAAHRGRVDTLFLAMQSERWGHFDAEHERVEVHPRRSDGDAELLDLAACHTLRNAGRVLPLDEAALREAQIDSDVAAIFRY